LGAQLCFIIETSLEKPSFGPSKWPRKLKPAKNSKLPKWPENCFEPFGKGGWPPISTWINPPSLGSNGLHCVEFPGEREKHLLKHACLAGEVTLLSLWKSVTNLWLEGLDLFNQSGYFR
jgi:hypothetical protein